MKIAIVLFLSIWNSITLCEGGGWTQAGRVLSKQFEGFTHYSHGPSATVYGAARSAMRAYKKAPSYTIQSVPSSHFRQGYINVTYARSLATQEEKRRLMVVIPGVFSGSQGTAVTRAMSRYLPLGYDVVALPNSWSPEYMHALPLANPGNPKAEGLAILDLIRGAKNLIGTENLLETHVSAESLGGFLTIAAIAQDSKQDPVVDGTVSIFGPPLHKGFVIQDLDTEYLRSQKTTGVLGWKKFFFLLRLLSHASSTSNSTDRQFAHSILYQEFQRYLLESTQSFHSAQGITGIPKSNILFREFIESYAPENLSDEDPGNYPSLLEWLQEIPEDRRKKIRFFAAKNDPLNSKVKKSFGWKAITRLCGKEQVILLENGGHLGYKEHPDFESFVQLEFSTRTATDF